MWISRRGSIARHWPWFVLLIATVPAIWHYVDFPDDIDGEYPSVVRPTFSARPPSAYRLAEPGDTIDRAALYASAALVSISAACWLVTRRAGLWPAGIAVGLGAGWFASTPGPTYDGWHGMGWGAIADPSAPMPLRLALGLAGTLLVGIVVVTLIRSRTGEFWTLVSDRKVFGLLIVGLVLIIGRAVDIPGVEPIGYWPRWSFLWGMLALGLAAVRLMPRLSIGRRAVLGLGSQVTSLLLIFLGLQVTWYHRPLERLRPIVPGRIYMSAMPTYEGLKVEQSRLHFKTIVNLFPEESRKDNISTRLPGELKFAEENGIRYIGSPGSAVDSDEFLDLTLALAQDPSAWPILIHCHGCMDRSPAWMGIYKFTVEGKPLLDILREIEAHRGVRPKASVTLLYNRVLEPRAPEHYAKDPTAKILQSAAANTPLRPNGRPIGDPIGPEPSQTAGANPGGSPGVPRR